MVHFLATVLTDTVCYISLENNFVEILTSVKTTRVTIVTMTPRVPTRKDHSHAPVNLDLMEMELHAPRDTELPISFSRC